MRLSKERDTTQKRPQQLIIAVAFYIVTIIETPRLYAFWYEWGVYSASKPKFAQKCF